MKAPTIVSTIAELRREIARWRADGQSVGLVPTMGALHEGHLSLVEAMRKCAPRTVVSIFVNPAQFAPHEDFDRYPRALENDVGKLAPSGADLVFAPSVAEMYPQGFATRIEVGGPSQGLETDFRPHFFGGVATVVAKLLIAAMPDAAIFGEKDYQQLMVIRRFVRDLDIPVEILGAPILREPDGLAMSSRNRYLGTGERERALALSSALRGVAQAIGSGEPVASALSAGRAALDAASFDAVQYIEVRDAETLAPVDAVTRPARVLAAVIVGSTRLIDNMPVDPPPL